MGLRIVQVDAFTDRAFGGNPAAVCILPGPRPDLWMQAVAGEMNLSETAFLVPCEDGFRLRWFTPSTEVELCGHATLASAHVLWEDAHLELDRTARFHTRSGLLTAERRDGWIWLDFPALMPTAAAPHARLLAALGLDSAAYTGTSRHDALVEVESAATVRSLQPDLSLLRTVATRGVIVTARADSGDHDFVSRFFAPSVGVNEDPVTGSAHCVLAPYWAGRLGRTELTGYQASARGGVVRTAVRGERVLLGGKAVTVLRGELA